MNYKLDPKIEHKTNIKMKPTMNPNMNTEKKPLKIMSRDLQE